MGFVVREIQPTPNPNAAKFMLDRPIAERPTSFLKPADAEAHPVAHQLFGIPGVTSLLFLGDFITVNKSPVVPWSRISKRVEKALAETGN